MRSAISLRDSSWNPDVRTHTTGSSKNRELSTSSGPLYFGCDGGASSMHTSRTSSSCSAVDRPPLSRLVSRTTTSGLPSRKAV
eukprot:scaffold197550_cov31-Tisochrysis_lutea.AAC.2